MLTSTLVRSAPLNLPLDALLQEIEAVTPDRSAPVVCCCAGGNYGAIAAAVLLDPGYPKVQTY